MRSLSRRTGFIVIAMMVGAVLFLSVPGKQMWHQVLQDAGHGPVFAVIAVVLALMSRARPGLRHHATGTLLWAFVGALVIGAATEALQFFQPGRVVSSLDLMHDAAGAALGLGILAASERDRTAGRGTGVFVALVALVMLSLQPWHCALAYANRASSFPTLARGDSPRDLYFILAYRSRLERVPLPAPFARPGEPPSLRVSYSQSDRPRFEIFEPAADWRGYQRVRVDLTNPADHSVRLVLKVQDEAHNLKTNDRFNLHLVMAPRSRSVLDVPLSVIESAPVGRRMDLTRIADVAVFTEGPPDDGAFYVSRIWLE